MPDIVISEFMDETAIRDGLAGRDVIYDPNLVDRPDDLAKLVAEARALIVRNRTQVRGALLEGADKLKVVGRLGVGLDNIDIDACRRRGVDVFPATGANDQSVAEYVICAAMLLLRGAYLSTAEVAAGTWPRTALQNGREVGGKTLGLIGFGGIGQLVARLAKALGMDVCAFDAMMDDDHPAFAELDVRCAGLDEVIKASDVISLHVPLVDSTRDLFDAARIAAMKPGAVLINTARGPVVDEAALVQALAERRIWGAGLDVFEEEPKVHPGLLALDNAVLLPHLGSATQETRTDMGMVNLLRDRANATEYGKDHSGKQFVFFSKNGFRPEVAELPRSDASIHLLDLTDLAFYPSAEPAPSVGSKP